MNQVLNDTLIKWAATRSDEVVFDPRNAFYSVDIVQDAFEKGKQLGVNELKQNARETFFEKLKETIKGLYELLDQLNNNGYKPSKFFLNHSIKQTQFIVLINQDTHESEEFIDFAYSTINKIQIDFFEKGINLDINFLDDTESFDSSLLLSDGYSFGYDLIHSNVLE